MTNPEAPVKLVISFDIKPGSQQVYYQFMISQFIPSVQGMGLRMSDAWHTVYGEYPSRSTSFVGLDLQEMRTFLISPEWKDLEERLQEYVNRYSWRIIPEREGGIQL